jgi:hypothetical protein
MARKPLTEQVIVVNPRPLDEDEADYLISQERQRSGREVSFEEFLKQHPHDVEKFVKRHGRQPGQHVENPAIEPSRKRVRRVK